MARELEIQITADTAQADQALARVEGALGKVEQAAEKADKATQKHDQALKKTGETTQDVVNDTNLLSNALLKYAGPAVILEATRRTLAFTEQIVQMSKRTGIAIEAVQKLGNTAERAGLSFDVVAGAIAKLDAGLAGGNLKVTRAVKNLGLEVDDLLTMQPDRRFAEIAKAIGGIEDPARRAEAAVAIFGRTGTQLVPMFMDIREGALEASSALSEDFVRAGDEVQGSLELIYEKMKTLGQAFLLWPAAWATKMRELGETIRGVAGELPAVASPGLPTNAPLPVPGDPFAPGGVGGQSLRFVEEELTETLKQRNATNKKLGQVEEALSAVEQQRINQAFAVSNRGPMVGPLFGQNIPGIGPGTFPGFALPTANLPSRGLVDLFNPATWNSSGMGTFRAPVESALSGGGAGGGNWFTNLFKGKAGNIAGSALGMLPGLIPGLSGRGASVGGSAGSLIGSIVGGPLAPVLGPIGGFLGGALGKLFGKSEHSKVNDQRDQFVAAAGGIHELNKKAQEAGLTLDKLLSAKKVKDFEAAVKELNGAFGDMEADQQRLRAAAEKYGFELKDMGQAFKQGEVTKGFKELGDDFRVLTSSGVEFNKVAEKMAPEFGALIHTAIETGTTVPKELEPILKRMIEMGVLVDKNGDKFTELGQIPFAESMTEGFDKIAKAIEKLTDLLANGIPDAARRGVSGANAAFGGLQTPDLNYGGGSGQVPGGGGGDEPVTVARGGIIQGRGRVLYFNRGGVVPEDIWRPIGTDIVPAMLTPGEMVIPRETSRELAPYMPRIIEGGIEDFIRDMAPTVGSKGGDNFDFAERPLQASGGDFRDLRLDPGAARTQPVPFKGGGGGDVVLIAVPTDTDADGIIAAVEKQLLRSIPGNRNRLRDMFDQLYQRKARRVA